MTNKAYDTFKKIVLMGVPAFITLVAGLLAIFDCDPGIATKIVAALGLVETFLGVVVDMLATNYAKQNQSEKTDDGK